MIHEAVYVRLLKSWKEKAVQLESQAENETGAKRDQLLAMAQVVYGCEEELVEGLKTEFLALADFVDPFVEAFPPEQDTPEQAAKRQAYV